LLVHGAGLDEAAKRRELAVDGNRTLATQFLVILPYGLCGLAIALREYALVILSRVEYAL
jgi:hypothetical protein